MKTTPIESILGKFVRVDIKKVYSDSGRKIGYLLYGDDGEQIGYTFKTLNGARENAKFYAGHSTGRPGGTHYDAAL